jgi:GT2 family glycosyltransferase
MIYTLSVIVTYKKPFYAFQVAKALLSQYKVNNKVIIIDNSLSIDDSKCLNNLICDVNNVHVVVTEENLGYAKGNNLGVKTAIEMWGRPDFIIFSNDDIVINDLNTVKTLIGSCRKIPDCGCIQPKILLENGYIQGPYSKSNIYLESLQYMVPILWIIFRRYRQLNLKLITKVSPCYRVMGAFFLIKTENFINCGLFDEGTFLFREEEILALKLNKIGLTSYYNPCVTVTHLQQVKSFEINNVSDKSDIYFYNSILKSSTFSIIIYKFSKYIYRNLYQKFIKLFF